MSAPRAAARRRSRQVALQVLYATDLAETGGSERPPEDAVFEEVAAHFELPEGARAFAKQLVAGVATRRAVVDDLLARHARNWRLSRMAAVDRNILRLGAYELAHTDTPVRVVIDEAIELARRFGDDPSPAFVNGVLDAVAHEVRAPGDAPRREAP